MTADEARHFLPIIQALIAGAPIECSATWPIKHPTNWFPAASPQFDNQRAYRVRPDWVGDGAGLVKGPCP